MKATFKLSAMCCLALLNRTAFSQESKPAMLTQKSCVAYVISSDDALGKIRNSASETISLEQTIRNYTDGMAELSFRDCPWDFKKAFNKHRKAWMRMIPFVRRYPDLRGDMHVLFEEFAAGPDTREFTPLLERIWDTWGEVELAKQEMME